MCIRDSIHLCDVCRAVALERRRIKRNAWQRDYDARHRDQIRERKRQFRVEQPERAAAINRQSRERYPEAYHRGKQAYNARLRDEFAGAPRRRRPWTAADDRYLRDHPDAPARVVAAALGRTPASIYGRRHLIRREELS